MRKSAAAFVGAVAVVLALGPGGVVAKPGGAPAVPLNPGQEAHRVTNSGGSGFFTYTIEGNQLCYTLEVRNLTGDPIGAHIHIGERGVAGPIVVPLLTPRDTTDTVSQCLTATEGGALTPAELAAIAADPDAYYVNVHTPAYTAGEIRGQLK